MRKGDQMTRQLDRTELRWAFVADSDLVDRLKQMLGPQHVRLVDAVSASR